MNLELHGCDRCALAAWRCRWIAVHADFSPNQTARPCAFRYWRLLAGWSVSPCMVHTPIRRYVCTLYVLCNCWRYVHYMHVQAACFVFAPMHASLRSEGTLGPTRPARCLNTGHSSLEAAGYLRLRAYHTAPATDTYRYKQAEALWGETHMRMRAPAGEILGSTGQA